MNIKYRLLLTANPLSDSKAARKVFQIINQLDVYSENIVIHMPGFKNNQHLERDTVEKRNEIIKELKIRNLQKHEDYHGKEPIFHTYCQSAGDMYFNDADFAQFMLDLGNKCPRFTYSGRTEMVLIPIESGKIMYEEVTSFNLEPFLHSNIGCSIEEFLFSVINILKTEPLNNSFKVKNFFNVIVNKLKKKPIGNPLIIKNRIQRLYEKKTLIKEEDTTEITIRLDNRILKHMKWKDQDEVFFISYSTKDTLHAYALKVLIEKKGKQVWIAPEGIPSGFDYAAAIPAALRITTRFVVLLSHNSAHSDWVRREIDRAINEKKKIDGVFVDGFSMNDINQYDHLSFLFANIQLSYTIDNLFDNTETLIKFIKN